MMDTHTPTPFPELPSAIDDFLTWPWERVQAVFQTLASGELTPFGLESWLDRWTHLHALIDESAAWLQVIAARDTRDRAAEERYQTFIETISLPAQAEEDLLKRKLLESGLEPPGFARPMQNMRADVELFREENLPLFADAEKLSSEYSRIIGAQTVLWRGEEKTLPQLKPVLQGSDRSAREEAWRLSAHRQLADRGDLNNLWERFLKLRGEIAANAGMPDYLSWRWIELRRFDYKPSDCHSFHSAIERAVVPAATRIYQRRAERLGLESLRPWDVDAIRAGEEPLKPFASVEELEAKCGAIFDRVDRELGAQFRIMRDEDLLDLENRVGKAPGGFCTFLPQRRRPFIFMNAVGLPDDVDTLLHEAGHCFHDFACGRWFPQWQYGTEFAEVASMSMELLAFPYLEESEGGFYSRRDAARARIAHLEGEILFWPYMAVVDAFQHWAYENPRPASRPENCDAVWSELWERFMPGIDFGDLDDERATGWHRKLHIFQYPLYYVEYGLAQLGAVQVWINSLEDYPGAVAAYRRALAMGAQPLPELFTAAGARFAFDVRTLKRAVNRMEAAIEEMLPLIGER